MVNTRHKDILGKHFGEISFKNSYLFPFEFSKRFHQSILKRQAPEKKKSQQYCCLAVGSRDKSVSIWMTASKRPSAVIYDLFDDSVVDLSWSVEKNILLACSPDGSVACLMFSEEELGTSLSQEDKVFAKKRSFICLKS